MENAVVHDIMWPYRESQHLNCEKINWIQTNSERTNKRKIKKLEFDTQKSISHSADIYFGEFTPKKTTTTENSNGELSSNEREKKALASYVSLFELCIRSSLLRQI